jgi:hypothetical protein
MSGWQWAEMLCGLAAALAGLLALGFVLFGPSYSYASGGDTCDANGVCTSTPEVHGTESLLQVGISSVTLVFLAILVACLIGVAVGAARHSRTGAGIWRALLWASTILVLGFIFLAALSIGPLLIPAGLLALAAACVSFGTPRPLAAHT